jgi:hypothetical protein
LFRLDDDFSESHDIADEHPDVLKRLTELWSAEADANNVLPLSDSLIGHLSAIAQPRYPVPQSVTLYPEAGPVSDEALPLLAGGGRIIADVEVGAQVANGGVVGDRRPQWRPRRIRHRRDGQGHGRTAGRYSAVENRSTSFGRTLSARLRAAPGARWCRRRCSHRRRGRRDRQLRSHASVYLAARRHAPDAWL